MLDIVYCWFYHISCNCSSYLQLCSCAMDCAQFVLNVVSDLLSPVMVVFTLLRWTCISIDCIQSLPKLLFNDLVISHYILLSKPALLLCQSTPFLPCFVEIHIGICSKYSLLHVACSHTFCESLNFSHGG